jgi:hypothetical protein
VTMAKDAILPNADEPREKFNCNIHDLVQNCTVVVDTALLSSLLYFGLTRTPFPKAVPPFLRT